MAHFLYVTIKFFRIPMLGFTIAAPTIGVLSGGGSVRVRAVMAAVAVMTCLHVAMYVLNDLVDLDIDLTQPRRAMSPLVRGVLTRRGAAVIVMTAIAASFLLDFIVLGSGLGRQAALFGAFLMLTIYDFFGKKSPWPPLTDFVQGAGCGLAVIYGGLANDSLTALSWYEAAYLMVYFAMINGIHGSLRDLENDAVHQVRSTALVLGAGAHGRSARLPGRLRAYGLALQSALGVLGALSLAEAARSARPDRVGIALGGLAILLGFVLLLWAYRYQIASPSLLLAGAAQLIVAIFPALAAAGSEHGAAVELALTAGTVGPMFTNAWYRRSFSWLAGIKPAFSDTRGPRTGRL